MKKNYFFVLFAALFCMAMPTAAQVTSMSDLFGKYKFTATITPTEAGTAYADKFKEECEVTIFEKTLDENTTSPCIRGLMGADFDQLITSLENNQLTINNPNPQYGLWEGYIGVADPTLENPQMYTMVYNVNPETKEITFDNVVIAGFSWSEGEMTATLYATITDAKLTPIDVEDDNNKEETTIDWVGTYNVAGTITMEVIEEYDYPETFEMEVVYNEQAKSYFLTKFFGQDVATLNNGGAGIRMTPSTTDPNTIEIATDMFLQEVEAEKKYLKLLDSNLSNSPLSLTKQEDGTYVFSYGFSIGLVDFGKDGTAQFAAWYQDVTATKNGATEEPKEIDWTGIYNVAGTITMKVIEEYDYPETFEMEVVYNEQAKSYFLTKFFGQDVATLNNGGAGIRMTPSTTDPNTIEIATDMFLQEVEVEKKYLKLFDSNLSSSPLSLTKQEGGTYAFSYGFSIGLVDFDKDGTAQFAAWYQNVTATKNDATETPKLELKSVNPADSASVTKVERIQFEFNKDVTVTMPEGGIEVKNTTTNEVFKLTRLYENEYMPKNNVIIEFEQVMTEGKDGKEELANQIVTTPGAYTYTIPAGMIKSADGEDFAEQTFTFNIVGTFPVDGYSPTEAEKIEKIELTFSKEIAEVADLSKLYVTDTYYHSPVAYVSGYTISEDKKTVTLTLDNAITGAGWYEFVIYEGIFTSADGKVNAYADCWLNVIDNTPGFVTSLNDGDRVQQLGNTLEITFKNVNEVKLAEGEDAPKATVYLPSTSEVEGTAVYADGKITVTFDQQFTEEGDYLFVIPEGMFTMDGVANEKREMNVTLFTFTVTPLEVVSVTPVAGAVDSISKIVVKFNQIVNLSYNEDSKMISQEIMLTCGDQQYTLTYAPESWNATDEIVYITNAEWNGYEFASTPIVAEGTYTLNLADIVVDYAGEEVIDEWGYPTITWHEKNFACSGDLTWTIGDTAVEGIEAEDGEQVIYDLLGRRVEKITGAGIYIVNGRKVVIK